MLLGPRIKNLAFSTGIGLLCTAIPYVDGVRSTVLLWVFILSTLTAYSAVRNRFIPRDFEARFKKLEQGQEDLSKVPALLKELKQLIESNKKLSKETKNLTTSLSTTIQKELDKPQSLLINRRNRVQPDNVAQEPRRSPRLLANKGF